MDDDVAARLAAHEQRSAERAAHVEAELKQLEGMTMSHEAVRDDVNVHNIFKGLGHDGVGGMGGLGGGLLGGVLASALFRRGGGIFGGDGDGGGGAVNQLTLNQLQSTLGNIQAAIPLSQANLENSIQQQTTQLAVALSGVKDSVTNTGTVLLQAINAIGNKIDAGTIANLQAELAESRAEARSRGTEVTVTQNVNQQQAQTQMQAQLLGILGRVNDLAGDLQVVKQGQVIFNSGLMAGSGTQSAANTRVA